ncbi:MAG TPA: response regulator [Opitutaceae bacterium]
MTTRILIIEDNSANSDLMVYLLNAFGYDSISAETGEERLTSVRNAPPDLVLCDVHLPGIDGYAVARAIKGDPELRGLPIVAVTALAMVGDREKVLAAGFDGYISKPINPESFARSLEAFLPPGAIPAAKIFPEPSVEWTARPTPSECAILLLVDDSPSDLALMESVFAPSGYETVVACNVPDALALARERRPNLVVCDVNMPGGSGFDLIDALRSDSDLCQMPVILITATAMSPDECRRGLARGARRYLTRPVEPQRLLDEVAACLREVHLP